MSSQKGNLERTRRQKHANSKAFKNDMHHTTVQLNVEGVCARCKGIIEWRIKYRKYKALTVPKKCTKCEQKTVHFAYHVICTDCATRIGVCGKCGKPDEDVAKPSDKRELQQKKETETVNELISEEKQRPLSSCSSTEDEDIAVQLTKSLKIQNDHN